MDQQTRQVVTRLKTVQGHLRGVQRMVAEKAYCIDVIKQVQAIQRALDKVNHLVLETHLKRGVIPTLQSQQLHEREQAIAALIQVFRNVEPHDDQAHAPEQGHDMPSPAHLAAIEARVLQVQGLIEVGAAGVEIIMQTKGIQRLLDRFKDTMLQHHLNGCVTTAIRNDNTQEREQMMAELLQVFDASTRL